MAKKKRPLRSTDPRWSGPRGKEAFEPDWTKPCLNCGAKPIVPATGLCGPCTFGEADTSGGNW
jgi:hypothetical protein